MFVGGEFFYDCKWQVQKPVIDTRELFFLNGGKACLIILSEYLLDRGIKKILLPAYLCPTILATLDSCGLTCDFYRVTPGFSIDLDDLVHKADDQQVVYFINYFGFQQPSSVRECLLALQSDGILLVEDNAHVGFWEQSVGDFTFNSMRKFCPYDGGYLGTSLDVLPFIRKDWEVVNRHLPVMREYRQGLGDYLHFNKGDHRDLENLYLLAGQYYDSDPVVEGNAGERQAIECLDWPAIKQARRDNYTYLLDLVAGIPGVTPIFPDLIGNIQPMGLPVCIDTVPRDWLFDELGKSGIGLTIHWDGLLHDSRLNKDPVVVDMASRILTLTIDQRVSHKQMDYMVQKIRDSLREYRGIS